jgi:hypothetical protein
MDMTNREIKKITSIVQKRVIQSFHHRSNITKLFSIIIEESRNQFIEDTTSELNNFLDECFYDALDPERNVLFKKMSTHLEGT